MTIQVASWADLGFRRLGPLPAYGGALTPAEIADRLTRMADYQATSDHWVRRIARSRKATPPTSIEVVGVVDRTVPLDDGQLAFLNRHFESEWTKVCGDLPQIRMDFADAVKLLNKAENAKERWRAFYFLSSAISFVGSDFLRPMLRDHAIPCFFRLYPKGKVVILRYDTSVDSSACLMRTMYAMAQVPVEELKRNSEGVATLRGWHMTSLSHLMPAFLDFFNYLFYPFVGGARANLPGLEFMFLLDPP